MIHTSDFKPNVIPMYGTGEQIQIDRVQDMNFTTGLDRTKIQEVGRTGVVSWRAGRPVADGSITQLEYGSLAFYNALANKGSANNKVEFEDFATSAVDILGYKSDDLGNFISTIWYPNIRVNGYTLNIADPEALIERSFSLTGDNEVTLQGDNQYLIYKKQTMSAGEDQTITVEDPVTQDDPDNSGRYLFRVIRVRDGVSTELEYSTDWECDGTTLTIKGTSNVDDVVKYWYSASELSSGQTTFTNNDSDEAGLEAKAASIYLAAPANNYLYRLQNVSVDIGYDRFDLGEIGNEDIVQRGNRDTTVTVTLGRILDEWTIEEVLRGEGTGYGKIDVRNFNDDFSLIIKLYDDADKKNFKIGYKFIDLAPTSLDAGVPLNDYITRNVELSGEEGFVTTEEGQL